MPAGRIPYPTGPSRDLMVEAYGGAEARGMRQQGQIIGSTITQLGSALAKMDKKRKTEAYHKAYANNEEVGRMRDNYVSRAAEMGYTVDAEGRLYPTDTTPPQGKGVYKGAPGIPAGAGAMQPVRESAYNRLQMLATTEWKEFGNKLFKSNTKANVGETVPKTFEFGPVNKRYETNKRELEILGRQLDIKPDEIETFEKKEKIKTTEKMKRDKYKAGLKKDKKADAGIGKVSVSSHTGESINAFKEKYDATGEKDYSLLVTTPEGMEKKYADLKKLYPDIPENILRSISGGTYETLKGDFYTLVRDKVTGEEYGKFDSFEGKWIPSTPSQAGSPTVGSGTEPLSQFKEGDTAVDQEGNRIVYKDGRWQPLQ